VNVVQLHRDTSLITITGIDSIVSTENKLQFRVKGGSTKSVTIKCNL